MRIFKVMITGELLLSILARGTEKSIPVHNRIPADAQLITTEFEHGSLVLYFSHDSVGTLIPEGGSMKSAMILVTEYKAVYKVSKVEEKNE